MQRDKQIAVRITSDMWCQLVKRAKGESVAAMIRIWIREKLEAK